MGNITFSKHIKDTNNGDVKDHISIYDTYQREYQYYHKYSMEYVDRSVFIGIIFDTSYYDEFRNFEGELFKNKLSVSISSLSGNNPLRKTEPDSCRLPMKYDYGVLLRREVKFIYENGEWKFERGRNSVEDFVEDFLWYSLDVHRKLFKQLHQEIEKHSKKEHFKSIPKSILGFPAIREAMQKLLDSDIEIEGDVPNAEMFGEGLIHLYRKGLSVDEMEEQLLMEKPRQKKYDERDWYIHGKRHREEHKINCIEPLMEENTF